MPARYGGVGYARDVAGVVGQHDDAGKCSGPQSKCGGREIVAQSDPHSGETDGGVLPALAATQPTLG